MQLDDALVQQATQELRADEGDRPDVYDDATGKAPILAQWRDGKLVPSVRKDGKPGKLTIGRGRNISDRPISSAIIELLFREDLDGTYAATKRIFPEFDGYTLNRRSALLGMVFNMGESRFRTFTETIPLIRSGKWDQAADHIKASAWASQVQPERRDRVVKQIRNG